MHGDERPTLRIFLNYRRDDSSGHALHLYDDLVERFGPDGVFMDIDKLEPGLLFDEAIDKALENCDVVICLIGQRWVSAEAHDGRRRLDDEDDWVRVELEQALVREGVRVIPALVQGAHVPRRDELPPTLAPLVRRHAYELSDRRWNHDVTELVRLLENIATQRTSGSASEVVQEDPQFAESSMASPVETVATPPLEPLDSAEGVANGTAFEVPVNAEESAEPARPPPPADTRTSVPAHTSPRMLSASRRSIAIVAVVVIVALAVGAAVLFGDGGGTGGGEGPVLSTAEATSSFSFENGLTRLRLAFSEPLDASSIPPDDAFTIKKGSSSFGFEVEGIEQNQVIISMGTGFPEGRDFSVFYRVPETNPIQDVDGNTAGEFAVTAVVVDGI